MIASRKLERLRNTVNELRQYLPPSGTAELDFMECNIRDEKQVINMIDQFVSVMCLISLNSANDSPQRFVFCFQTRRLQLYIYVILQFFSVLLVHFCFCCVQFSFVGAMLSVHEKIVSEMTHLCYCLNSYQQFYMNFFCWDVSCQSQVGLHA